MADIFGREIKVGSGFKADGATVKFGEFGCPDGLLIQNLSIQYQQQVNRLYEVGCPDVYLIAGRTNGTISMARVIGPKGILKDFYKKYGDPCEADDLQIDLAPGLCKDAAAPNSAITAKKAVITSIGLSVAANDMMINEQVEMMFITLENGKAGSSPDGAGSPASAAGIA